MVGSGDARGSIARTPRVGSEGEEKRRMINLEHVYARFTVAPMAQGARAHVLHSGANGAAQGGWNRQETLKK